MRTWRFFRLIARVLAYFLTFFGGVFASNLANDFGSIVNSCPTEGFFNIYLTKCFWENVFQKPSFFPFFLCFIFAIICELVSDYFKGIIDELEKQEDQIYGLGLETVNKEKKELEFESAQLEANTAEEKLRAARADKEIREIEDEQN